MESLWSDFTNLPGLFPKTNAAEDKRTEDFVVVSKKMKRTISDLESPSARVEDDFLVVHFEELEIYYREEEPCSG